MKLCLLCLSLSCAILLPAVAARAQDNGLKSVDTKGTLEEAFGYQLKVKDKAGKELNVFIDPINSTLRYSGTATTKMLGPGMMVRLTGLFDAKGNSQSDLKELEIFRPKVGQRLMQEDVMSQTPGIYPADDKKNMPAENKAAETKGANSGKANKNSGITNSKDSKSSKANPKQRQNKTASDAKSGNRAEQEFQMFKVVGQITSVQGNKIQINTGRQSLIVPLAASASIKVTMPDAEYAVKGDEVHVVGLSNAEQPDAVQAKSVTITGAKPLGSQQLENPNKPSDKKKDPKSDNKEIGKKTK